MQNFLVLFLRPRVLRDRGVQVVVPPLPALLGDAPGQLLSYRGPLSGAVRAHQFDDFGLGAAREGSGARERSTGGPKIPTLRADVLFGRPRAFRSFLVCLARPCRRSRRRRRRAAEPRRRARRRARGRRRRNLHQLKTLKRRAAWFSCEDAPLVSRHLSLVFSRRAARLSGPSGQLALDDQKARYQTLVDAFVSNVNVMDVNV